MRKIVSPAVSLTELGVAESGSSDGRLTSSSMALAPSPKAWRFWTSPEQYGAMSAIMKVQIDWIPRSVDAIRLTPVAAIIVFGLGSAGRGGATPLKLVLAGAVPTTLLSSLTTAILIFDQTTLDIVRLSTTRSLAGRTIAQVAGMRPYILICHSAAFIFSRHIMTLI